MIKLIIIFVIICAFFIFIGNKRLNIENKENKRKNEEDKENKQRIEELESEILKLKNNKK